MSLDLGCKRARDSYVLVGESRSCEFEAPYRQPSKKHRRLSDYRPEHRGDTGFLYAVSSSDGVFETMDILHDLATKGLTLAAARASTFEDLSCTVRNGCVVDFTKHLLHRLCALSRPRDFSMPLGMAHVPALNTDIFLSAFVIKLHPARVFNDPTDKTAQPLLAAADALLCVYNGLCTALLADASAASVGQSSVQDVAMRFPSLTATLYTFLHKFKEWKMPEESMLVSRWMHGLQALYESQVTLEDEGCTEASDLHASFEREIVHITGCVLNARGKACKRETLAEIRKLRQSVQGRECKRARVATPYTTTAVPSVQRKYYPIASRLSNEQLTHELELDATFTMTSGAGEHLEKAYSKP